MLIIPTEGKISWKNPPVITICLIVVNCLVFFLFQSTDTEKTIDAFTYYFESGLADIEVPKYQKYIGVQTEPEDTEEGLNLLDPGSINVVMAMQQDSGFMDRLYNDTIITAEDEEYEEWKELRTEFDHRQSKIISYRFGLIPKRAGPVNFMTYMFLHGGIMHLVGNMIFLWIVGCVLEMGCGRIYYGAGYLLVGIFSALFYFIVHYNSYIPMIGASGAISGLMGAFTVLYATTRIRVFVSTGFYFDYFRVPALILLPFWIGKEFFQYYAQGPEQVAYMAHAGGLIGGALLGVLGKQFFDESKKAFFDETPEDRTPALMESALAKSARLDFNGARVLLQEVLALQPNHPEALLHLFRVDMQNPDQSNLDTSANRLLSVVTKTRGAGDRAWDIYNEYLHAAKSPRLSLELKIRLSALFVETNHIEEAEHIVGQLLRNNPEHSSIPTVILRLIRGFEGLKNIKKVRYYTDILCSNYPMSHEVQMLQARNQ